VGDVARDGDVGGLVKLTKKSIRPSFRRRPESSHKNTLRSRQNHDVALLTWGLFNHLDSGLRRNDEVFSNGIFGVKGSGSTCKDQVPLALKTFLEKRFFLAFGEIGS
jgi:hypothetical protein